MRLVLVSLSFAPDCAPEYPGTSRYAVELSKALTRMGIEVRVVTPRVGDSPKRQAWGAIEVIRLSDSKRLLGSMGAVAYANGATIGLQIARHRHLLADVDVVQTDLPLPWIRGVWPRKPLIYVIHHAYRVWQGTDLLWVPFARYYQSKTIQRADMVVVPSHTTAREVMKVHGVSPSKITVIPHGVDQELFRRRPTTSLSSRKRGPILVYVGLLERRKGVQDLLPVYARVKEQLPDARLFIVGDGPLRKSLENAWRGRFSTADIIIRRNVSDTALAALLNASDYFIWPSRQEGFGFSVAEAMACGKVVLAYDTPINREIVADGGVLVPPGRPDALAAAVINLERDSESMERVGRLGEARAQSHFAWGATAQTYCGLYGRLMEETRSKSTAEAT